MNRSCKMNIGCMGELLINVNPYIWSVTFTPHDDPDVSYISNQFDDEVFGRVDGDGKRHYITVPDFVWQGIYDRVDQLYREMDRDANPQFIHAEGHA